jgi:hypothetical protein
VAFIASTAAAFTPEMARTPSAIIPYREIWQATAVAAFTPTARTNTISNNMVSEK